jgi:hypothetical protein
MALNSENQASLGRAAWYDKTLLPGSWNITENSSSPLRRQENKPGYTGNLRSIAASSSYGACTIKRSRATKAEMQGRLAGLKDIVAAQRPMTVRQVFYQAEVVGLVPKTEAGYRQVGNALVAMRRSGEIPFSWITDGTRLRRHPRTFSGIEAALQHTADCYRKALWDGADVHCEIWCEKDALSGVIYPITSQYDVSLMTARGYSSLSFLAGAAEEITEIGKPAYIYHLGDYDPSGQDAARKIEEELRELAPDAEIHFERLAVTPEQIERWNFPTRPTKQSDSRAKGFGDISVELDAIPSTCCARSFRTRSMSTCRSTSLTSSRRQRRENGKRSRCLSIGDERYEPLP